MAAQTGSAFGAGERRRWWDYAIVTAAVTLFLWIGVQARMPDITVHRGWLLLLSWR